MDMNHKAKGSRAEHKAIRILELAGYAVCRSGASLGVFDVVAIGANDVRCIQVKSGGKYCSAVEREQLQLLVVPPFVSKEIWRFPDRCRAPLIERLT
jgi:Holliday junction resolvase